MRPQPLLRTASFAFSLCLLGLTSTTLHAQKVPPALSAAAISQIDALETEKASRTPAQQKMDSRLVHLVKKQRGEGLGAGLANFEARVKPSADGYETVDVTADVSDALIADLQAAGGTIISSVPRFRAIRVRLPLAQAEVFAARPDVRFLKPAAQAMTHAGPLTTEGDVAHRADTVRSTLKATGRGVKIGVISDSVDNLTTSQTTGELGTVTVLPGQAATGVGLSGEGTAMLEIVHDLAPDADLFFASAFISEAQFAQNILDLRSAGCDIIVDDVGYFDESPFQDGPVAQAVESIVADGGLYFSSAGNEGNKDDGTSGVWEGDFVDGGPTGAGIAKPGRLHSFGATNYDTLTVPGTGATLFWADPAGASTNDYDLYVFSADGNTLLAASTNLQNGTQDPYEIVPTTTTNSRLVVVKSLAAQPRFLHLNTLRGRLGISTDGTIQGHPAAAGAFAVAATSAAGLAVPFTGSAVSETFTTDGPRRVFFHADGTPITSGNLTATGGVVRAKPDLTAADGVKTSVTGFTSFYGTSAAAPHAAAIAGLLWSRNRALTNQQIRTALMTTATDIETAGFDRNTGVGIVNALAASQAVTGGPILVPTFTITGEGYSPANGRVDPGETITLSVGLQNTGTAATSNLVATLAPTGGVFNPSAAQTYGVIAAGATVTKSFTFQGIGPVGTSLAAAFTLTDGSTVLGTPTATYTFGTAGTVATSSNATAITIPTVASAATPYPSGITVSGVTGLVGKVTVTLTNFSHTYPSDVDIVLVSPSGRKVEIMSDAGTNVGVSGITLTFDDSAASQLPSTLVSGTFRPTPLDSLTKSLPATAPAAPYLGTLSAFVGDSPNGTWQLYVRDEFNTDGGSIAGGWTLNITPDQSLTSGANPDITPVLTTSSSTVATGSLITYTATVYNVGSASANSVVLSDTLPASTTFLSASASSGTVSNVGNVVTANLGTIPRSSSAVVTIVARAPNAGTITNTASVSLTGTENNSLNNSCSTSVIVGQPNLTATQPAGWSNRAVVSTTTGTNTDASTITSSDSLYLDFATVNNGTISTPSSYTSDVYVDGAFRYTVRQQIANAAGSTQQQLDLPLGSFLPGTHTLSIVSDAQGIVAESNEADNTFTRTFSVAGPNLAPFQRAGYGDKIVVSKTSGATSDSPSINADDAVFAAFGLINSGNTVTGIGTTAVLTLDGNIVAQANISAALAAGADTGSIGIALGTLSAGVHTLQLTVDSTAVLSETDETDNVYTKTFVVNALPTISPISNLQIQEDATNVAVPFTVADSETPAGNIAVSAITDNPALLPLINLGGSLGNRTLSFTPAANANGTANIIVTIADGSGGSATAIFKVLVDPVNDAPSFTKGIDIAVAEDAGSQSFSGWATNISAGPADEAGQTLLFIVNSDNPSLFRTAPSVSNTGALTFTPAADASGTANVSVTLVDDGTGAASSAPQTFTIVVNAVNDPPSFTKGADITVDEDSGPTRIADWATGISAGPGEASQTVSFVVSTDHPELFSEQPTISSAGVLTFTPAANTSGLILATVQAKDDGGGTDTSGAQTFKITINPVNDAPSFTLVPRVVVAQDAGPQSVPQFAASISAGPADEASQTVSFAVTPANPDLFATAPAIAADGTLTFAPLPSASGKTTVSVVATDSDGASSATKTCEIAVTSYSDALGTYSGLALAPNSASASAAQTGAISVTFAPGGRMTGSLTLGGTKYAFKGFALNDGKVRFGTVPSTTTLPLKRKGGLSTLQLGLTLDVSIGAGALTGSITDGAAVYSAISAELVPYDKKTNPAPATLVSAYTLTFPARTSVQQGGLPEASFPQGDGAGTMQIVSTGKITLKATLADGSKISLSSALSKQGNAALYSVTDRKQGAIAGTIHIETNAGVSDAAGLDLRWFKPALAKAKTYPAGWATGIGVDFIGSKFAPTKGTSIFPSLKPVDLTLGNATFATLGGEISSPLGKALNIDDRNRVTVVTSADDKLKLTLNAKTGLITGSFIHPTTNKSVKLNGAVLQTPATASGFFLSPAQSGKVTVLKQ